MKDETVYDVQQEEKEKEEEKEENDKELKWRKEGPEVKGKQVRGMEEDWGQGDGVGEDVNGEAREANAGNRN